MMRHVLIFGLVGGLLIATLQYTEYRFVIIEHSVELYSALVAILFATFGIWLGLRITRSRETIRETVVVKEILVPAEAPPERSGAESKDLLFGSGPLGMSVPFAPQYGPPAGPRHHPTRARNTRPDR